MDTRIWGPAAWKFMHTVTFNFPDRPTELDKRKTVYFFQALANVLPCEVCQGHFRKELEKNPIAAHLGSRDALSRWLVDLHNEVNKRLGKPTLDYEFVKDQYDSYRGTCVIKGGSCPLGSTALSKKSEKKMLPLVILLVIAVILLSAYVAAKSRRR